jgi:hypothetical protein
MTEDTELVKGWLAIEEDNIAILQVAFHNITNFQLGCRLSKLLVFIEVFGESEERKLLFRLAVYDVISTRML